MLYTLKQVGIVGTEGDGKSAAAPMIACQVGKVDRFVMLHCSPHVLGLFILVVGIIADSKRPLGKCLASYPIHAERITPLVSRIDADGGRANPFISSFNLSPILISPCRAAWA